MNSNDSLPDGAGGKAVAWLELKAVTMEDGPRDTWWKHGYNAAIVEMRVTNPHATTEPSLSREGASVSNAVRGLVDTWHEAASLLKPNDPYAVAGRDCANDLARAIERDRLAVTSAPGGEDCGCDPAFCRDLSTCRRNVTRATPTERTPQRGGEWDWFAECRRVLEDVSTEMRATGRGDTRFRRLIESMPREVSASAARSGGDAEKIGGTVYFDREESGVVIDALIEHRASAEKRYDLNSASNSNWRADKCAELIGRINGPSALQPNTTGEV